MKLTEKDKIFLERLKGLTQIKELWVELKQDGYKRLVLKGNYGERINQVFKMSRQGVRWRFYRLFNLIYASAYETIYFIETTFGTELRDKAIEIAKEKIELFKKIQQQNEPWKENDGKSEDRSRIQQDS